MQVSRGKFVFLLVAIALFVAWKNLSYVTQETVVLHIPLVSDQDTYATLWVVDDKRNVWIRAETRQRLWLKGLQDSPTIELARDGRTARYRAKVIDTEDARAHVGPMFREKYGVADQLRDIVNLSETVPIRLERL